MITLEMKRLLGPHRMVSLDMIVRTLDCYNVTMFAGLIRCLPRRRQQYGLTHTTQTSHFYYTFKTTMKKTSAILASITIGVDERAENCLYVCQKLNGNNVWTYLASYHE